MSSTTSSASFQGFELGMAWIVGITVEVLLFGLVLWAGENEATIQKAPEPVEIAVPINVKPVLDDLPLLKLGSKKKLKPKLPDMWRKVAPTPKQTFEERSAPSEKADTQKVEDLPKSELADEQHEAPPEEAETAEHVDETMKNAEPTDTPAEPEEGAAEGVKEGTETDPLKARAVSLYQLKIAAWFNSRFRPPVDAIECSVLKKLSAGVRVSVGGDRSVTGFALSSPSGNPVFDARVSSFLGGLVGQQLPPPPPLYPDILESSVFPRLSGAAADCDSSP